MSKLFALNDRAPEVPCMIEEGETALYNNGGYGIFHVVNDFEGRRVVENLRRINYWFADLDTGTKEEQLERIATHLKPSRVIETKKGHHVYYKATDATLGNWTRIVRWGLCPALAGDPRATDPLRLLRVPGFYHHKAEPFLVRTIAQADVAYTEAQMMEAFPDRRVEVKVERVQRDLGPMSFWAKVAELSAVDVIERLSGHEMVRCERYRLKSTAGGKHNIEVKKPGERWQGSPCWITEDDRFAGVEGGSSAGAWLRWYKHDWGTIAAELKKLFPELEEE